MGGGVKGKIPAGGGKSLFNPNYFSSSFPSPYPIPFPSLPKNHAVGLTPPPLPPPSLRPPSPFRPHLQLVNKDLPRRRARPRFPRVKLPAYTHMCASRRTLEQSAISWGVARAHAKGHREGLRVGVEYFVFPRLSIFFFFKER